MSQTAMDAAAFTEMKELMGDTFKEVVIMCLQSLPEQSDLLETAISNDDAEQVFNIAHRLKSSCGSIGAFGLAEKAEMKHSLSFSHHSKKCSLSSSRKSVKRVPVFYR